MAETLHPFTTKIPQLNPSRLVHTYPAPAVKSPMLFSVPSVSQPGGPPGPETPPAGSTVTATFWPRSGSQPVRILMMP
jgi:hypothetical protein